MIITIKKTIATAIGFKQFDQFGVNKEAWGWRDGAEVNLGRLSDKKLTALVELLETRKALRGVGILLRDIATWRAALNDSGSVKARTLKQFEPLLRAYLLDVPGHRVYKRVDDAVWLPYYVNEIRYHPERRDRGDYSPAFVSVSLIWETFGGKKSDSLSFQESDCRGIPVAEALARQSYVPETPELRAAYITEVTRFGEVIKQIGKQYIATGTGTDNLDGNPSTRDSSWYWGREHTIQLVSDEGEPSRVVVDVFFEKDDTDRRENDRTRVDVWFWSRVKLKIDTEDDDGDDVLEQIDDPEEVEIPIHVYVAVFHLKKHLRMRVHVNHLTPYEYDAKLADKLVLPKELKALVHVLIEHKDAGFRDIVRGKAGGAVVLLAGEPGVGKTLTAEVYAESEKRALYSIQCSQLGTDPDTLEDALLKVFARARRWNAVVLLDEADVYVHERGDDLVQNAIVGVFLRVLEYQSSVLFLTINRPDDVDDAIASRCVARLNYPVPGPLEQWKIWRVLSENVGVKLADSVLTEICEKNPGLTGRDVKNLLKLAMLVARGQPITAAAVEYVKQFKPTGHRARE